MAPCVRLHAICTVLLFNIFDAIISAFSAETAIFCDPSCIKIEPKSSTAGKFRPSYIEQNVLAFLAIQNKSDVKFKLKYKNFFLADYNNKTDCYV